MKTSLTRKQQSAVARLERAGRNEDVHTRHVAALALSLFDAVAESFAFTTSDRQHLELAARLHDIGYASAPLDHVRAGAARVLRDRSLGLPAPARQQLAALILLHSRRDYRAQLAHPVFRDLPERDRVLQLAALLRVADGLDNGHVQDAAIARVHVGRKRVTLRVRAPAWPRNLVAARHKADLWDAALPLPLKVKAEAGPRHWKLVRRRLPATEAARRLLALEYRQAMAAMEEAQAGEAESLHQLRVALRRSRILLRAFAPALPDAPARAARRELVRITTALGPARDLDVWRELLPRGAPVLRKLDGQRAAAQADVAAALTGPSLNALRRALGLLLRVELARATPADGQPAGKMAVRAVREAARHAGKRVRHHANSVAGRHTVRAALRRVTLTIRVLAPLLPAAVRRRGKVLHKTEQALGRLHDLETLCALLRQGTRNGTLEAQAAKQRARMPARLHERAFRKALRALR